ncbi:MAG: cell division protein FtsZ [Flavobacteriales bacterium]|nr:cell division protein FtsZ [Flavobacteriales bacterium]
MKFDLPKENSSIIKVLGVGGGGSNAVNHMYKQGIKGVDFLVFNTDQQALDVSPVPLKVQLGATLTEGRGAGSLPEVGKNAAIENIDDIKDIINTNTKMVFITAGMGGGTGTGAAPVIAKTAREMGVLTVGIVTMPFFFEGRKRRQQAEAGIEEIREQVDTLLIINNEKLREMCGNLPIAQAFAMADNVLTTAAKGIAEIITRTGYINVDFEDVRTVMTDSGVAIMGSAAAEGEDRATKAVEKALASPLLNDNNIKGARYVLLNITFGNQEVLMDEISDITDYIQDEAGSSADVIWGYGMDESLGDQLSVTIIATGFNQNPNTGVNLEKKSEMRKMNLEEEAPSPEVKQEETAQTSDEPFLKRPDNEVSEDSEKSAPAETNVEGSKTFFDLTEEIEDAEESSESKADDPTMFTDPKPSQRIFEFDINADKTSKEVSIEENETEEEGPFLKGEEAEKEEEDERPSWEPFIRSTDTSDEAQPEEKKPITQDQPSFKTTTPESESSADSSDEKPSREEQAERANQRLSRLRELSMRLRTPSGINELENEPAFKRKQINLDDVPHSSESSSSRFTLGEDENEDGEKRTKLRPNNGFLHDNVD